jgi:hypothetical protein
LLNRSKCRQKEMRCNYMDKQNHGIKFRHLVCHESNRDGSHHLVASPADYNNKEGGKMMKELFIEAHEELIQKYMASHPEATENDAYEATADLAWNYAIDKLADTADRLRDERRENEKGIT